MGIPGFYRWLVYNYPNAVGNRNGLEFDNLYLDMNGIIHPCFHPDDPDEFQPTTFGELLTSVFDYVDRLIAIVRPTKLIYFAIDGVAPRAKLNQQRAGRCNPTKNNQIAEDEEFMSEFSQLKDPNIITPGTEFMCEFSKALEDYIKTRLRQSPAWMNLKVILSDTNVPGEGEHKIISFIRSQRSLHDYDVNTRHCLHSMDADLILLALVTHELHISILREEQQRNYFQNNNTVAVNPSGSRNLFPAKKACSFQFLHVWILREYLELVMQPSDVPEGFEFDIERAVDDFVFLSFFLGNDFLPHLPSLRTHEGALDLLMMVYKRVFKSLGGYIVDAQRVNDPKDASYLNLERVERLILAVGSYEDKIFKRRMEDREQPSMRNLSIDHVVPSYFHSDNIIENTKQQKEEVRQYKHKYTAKTSVDKIKYGWNERYYQEKFANKDHDNLGSLKRAVVDPFCWEQRSMKHIPIHLVVPSYFHSDNQKEEVRKYKHDKSYTVKTSADKIKYGTDGWNERYYQENFANKGHDNLGSLKRAVVKEYVKGLCWILLYYYSGVPSWSWFYPYDYGPCASDLKGLDELEVEFEQGSPFDQLIAVLPPRSADILPKAYRHLMTDLNSDIGPREFHPDNDGKKTLSQGPFVDEKRLLAATKKEYEAQRNMLKRDLLFVRARSDFGYQLLCEIDGNQRFLHFVNLNLHPLDSSEWGDIICVDFDLAKPSIVVPRVLEHVKFPEERTVYESDIKKTVLWHESQDNLRGQRVPYQTRENESIGQAPNSREGLYNHPNRFNTSDTPRGRNNAWVPWFTSNQQESSRGGGGQFWPHKDSQDTEHGQSSRW